MPPCQAPCLCNTSLHQKRRRLKQVIIKSDGAEKKNCWPSGSNHYNLSPQLRLQKFQKKHCSEIMIQVHRIDCPPEGRPVNDMMMDQHKLGSIEPCGGHLPPWECLPSNNHLETWPKPPWMACSTSSWIHNLKDMI